ncbi:hypothetical protein LCGC14_1930200 [marine sediment metagenome]|uniref:Uncharacterized protein n=1 Tax=marine sediment metagenome TaxID=412755 RepID=A0A0F9FN97_9ZZZZ
MSRQNKNMWDSRRRVVELFLSGRSGASRDGSVHTNGSTLCVGPCHVAFWHQSTIYLVSLESPNSCVRAIQGMAQMSHSYKVVNQEKSDD